MIHNNINSNNACVCVVNVLFMHLSKSQYSHSAYGRFSLFHIHSDIIASVFVDKSRVDFPFDIYCVKCDIYYILLYPHTYSSHVTRDILYCMIVYI